MNERIIGPSRPSNLRLDELDEQILWELSRDARLSNTALAARVHVSPSTTHARVKALKDAGVIRSSHVELDYEALGMPVQGLVSVKLQAQARPQIKTYARKVVRLPNVVSVFFVGGQVDFLIHIVCTSTGQLRDFVASYISMDPVVASTETNIVFEHLIGAEHHGTTGGLAAMRKPFE
ncbi:Lrp/AsnC family transcriptional regulator [Demequina capsici]|uniref:Lrp/AsnC family transcriptional regulator n=1 Tax=Demequina capsici TaxID=3075620 RepID=A0AA96FD34_9MICO|nr:MULTISPECIES: Lrp/AsnC family transcriptional regulator [unclassified Demequina]WNM24472.1 Lrp/AsnC family transcriptional regulator [Demequina sp. OYTSA14]WNM27302.1 Lrp/AsnC family transcriptional regulator [Demequina sp. PMTSA13]